MKEVYDDLHSTRGPYHWCPSLYKKEKAFVIAKWLKDCTSILDVGTGDGALLSEVSQFLSQSQIVGTDISSKAIILAKEKLPNKDFILAAAEYLPFRESCFLGCYCSEVIEHLRDPKRMLADCYQMLKDKGKMVVTTPNKAFREEKDPLHFREYTFQELVALLRASGFKVERVLGIGVRFRGYGRLYRLFSWLKCNEGYWRILHSLQKLLSLPSTFLSVYFTKGKSKYARTNIEVCRT